MVFSLPLKTFLLMSKKSVISENTVLRSLQLEKADCPIDVTELGIVAEVSPVQLKKTLAPIAFMEFGITVFLQPAIRVPLFVSMIALQFSAEL